MGEKKQKYARTKKIKQVLVVGACVLFVVLMILSGMSSHWLTIFRTIKPGDVVVVDYTLFDSAGNAILTSDRQLAAKGTTLYTNQRFTLSPGQSLNNSLYPVPIYTGSNESTKAPTEFAILPMEYATINNAIIGMKGGDKKHIQIPDTSEPRFWEAATIAKSGLNMSELTVGELIPMALSNNPDAMTSNTTVTYMRVGRVASITADGIVVDINYPAADISIVSINRNT